MYQKRVKWSITVWHQTCMMSPNDTHAKVNTCWWITTHMSRGIDDRRNRRSQTRGIVHPVRHCRTRWTVTEIQKQKKIPLILVLSRNNCKWRSVTLDAGHGSGLLAFCVVQSAFRSMLLHAEHKFTGSETLRLPALINDESIPLSQNFVRVPRNKHFTTFSK